MTAAVLLLSLTCASAQDVYIKKDKPAPPAKEMTATEMANTYFENCQKKQSAIMTNDTQEMLCACTAAKLSENMTVAEMEAMYTDTPEGQNMRNKMLLQVYAPCIEYPTHDLVLKGCLENDVKLKRKKQVCGCMAQNMSNYISVNAQSALISALQENPKSTDPLSTLLQSPTFAAQAQQTLAACVQQHELGAR